MVLAALAALGQVKMFAGSTLLQIFRPPFYTGQFLTALAQIGWLSLPVVGFTGGALVMQIYADGARAIPTDPSVIFFDEPTTGLDPIMDQTISALIRDIVVKTKATTLTITHDMITVHSIADQVALLDAGTIRWRGTPDQMATANEEQLKAFLFSGC